MTKRTRLHHVETDEATANGSDERSHETHVRLQQQLDELELEFTRTPRPRTNRSATEEHNVKN